MISFAVYVLINVTQNYIILPLEKRGELCIIALIYLKCKSRGTFPKKKINGGQYRQKINFFISLYGVKQDFSPCAFFLLLFVFKT